MLTLEEIKKKLRDRRLAMVADETGVHYNTIQKIRDGETTNPTYDVLLALSNYLEDAR